MNANTTQPANPFLAEMLRGNQEVLDRARAFAETLAPADLEMRSPAGGWTAGQVFEHLVVAGKLYVDQFDSLIDRARAQGKTTVRVWRPTLMGGAIMRGVSPNAARKNKTFSVFEPGATPRANVVREFIKLHETLERQIGKADGIDLRSVKLSSPVSSLIRLNLGDAIGITVLHAQRHLLQVGRILQQKG